MTTTDPETIARSLAQAGRHVALCRQHLGPLVHQQISGATEAWDELAQASVALTRAGVVVDAQGTPQPAPDSLAALRKIEQSREEGESLLHYLREALLRAEYLDKKRGDWVGDMADTERGETPGTNYAEALQELLLKLEGELGAVGGGRE